MKQELVTTSEILSFCNFETQIIQLLFGYSVEKNSDKSTLKSKHRLNKLNPVAGILIKKCLDCFLHCEKRNKRRRTVPD